MKKNLLSLGLLFVSIAIFAQDIPTQKPVNPEFIQYFAKKSNGEVSMQTQSGYFLGEIPSPLVKEFGSLVPNTSKGLPASYDLRTVSGGIYLTPVKNQGLEGACWAFATYAATESYWKKIGLSTYDLSEQNLATCHGFDWTPSEGGNSDLSVAYLSRRSGPISEADDPYTLPANPTCETGHTPIAYVAQSRTLPGSGDAAFSRDVVKQAIMDYGAIYINMYFDDDYMSYSNYTYYYNGSGGTNHGVSIVGWDNAKVCSGGIAGTPALPGAWIVKNSWGTSWGQSGYFYISFYDTEALSDVAYFPSHVDYNANSQIYYYDDFGATSAAGYSDGSDFALVKYVASTNQQLSKLGTFVLDANTTLSFDVYDNFNGTTLSGLLGSITNQVCQYPGYYTFDLATAINLTSGNDFYIKVRYNSGEDYPIPIETEYPDYASGVTYQTGKCWISSGGSSWTAIGGSTSYDYDLCIKAYATTVSTEAPVAEFTADQTTITVGTTVYFTDASSGIPTGWLWTFEGGSIANSTSANPSVTYNTPGTYDVTLYVSNSVSNDELTKTNYITVTSAPITCEYVTNEETGDNIVYYTAGGAYLSGYNSYLFSEFAEHYTDHLNNLVTGARIGVVKADALSPGAKITMKIWNTSAGKPGTVLYSEDFDIADFTAEAYNDITFATPTTVPNDFFIGYQIYFTTPQDTFAVYQVEDRGTASTVTSTAFLKYSGTWRDVDVLFIGLNTAFCIYPEICPTPPNADFTATPTSGCGSVTVTFTDASSSNTDTWDWDFGDGQTSTLESPVHTYSTPGTYTVSLTATNSIGTDTKTMTDYIVVGTIPTAVTVSGGGTQCGGTMLLSASGGTGGTIYWQNTTNNGTSTTTASSSQSVSATGTYYFRSRSVEGCWGAQGSASVTINTVPTNVSVSGGGTQCGGTIALTATGGTGGIIYFQNTTTGGTSTATPSSYQVLSTSGTYYFRAQSAAGCWGNEGSATVTINAVPTSVSVSGGGTQCGGSMILTASGGTGGTIYWQNTTNNGTSTATASSSQSVSASGTYYFRSQSAQGCWGAQGSASVTINPIPADVSVSGGGTQCGGTMLLTATGGTGGTIYWQNTTSAGTSIATASSSQSVSESGTYYFRSQSVAGCWGNEGFDEVTIHPALIIEISSTDESAPDASDGTATVTVTSGTPDYAYAWNDPSAYNTAVASPLPAGTWCVTVTDFNDCTVEDCVTINTMSPPVAEFEADQTLLCDEFTVNFTDESLYFPTTWAWDFGDGNTSDEQNPTHTYSSLGSYTVSLTVTNSYGTDNTLIENFIVISETPVIEYETVPTDIDHPNEGEIHVTVTGGSEPYTVEWDPNFEETSLDLTNLTSGDYYLTVTEAAGCMATETITVEMAISVENNSSSFKIYPNPASDFITIEFSGELAKNIELVNVIGEVIISNNNTNMSAKLNLENLAPGTYFINLKFSDKTTTHKIIIK